MLKICFCSDNHGDRSSIMKILSDNPDCDYYLHAGDSLMEPKELSPFISVLGNNDWGYQYGPEVKNLLQVTIGGVRWQVCHYREKLDPVTCKIAVCGHTHRPFIETTAWGTIVMNPGSPTFPRTQLGPTCARVLIQDEKVVSAEIVQLSE